MPGMKKGSSMEKTKPQQYSCETCVKSAVIPLSRLPPRTGIIPRIPSISLLDLTLVITVTVKSS